MKRIHQNITDLSTHDAASVHCVGDDARPSLWTDKHEAELDFQHKKLRKKTVAAQLRGHLLPSEQSEELSKAACEEAKRQAASFTSRTHTRVKYQSRTTAMPPTNKELRKAVCFLDDGVDMPRQWLATLSCIAGVITRSAAEATLFIAANPRAPSNPLVTLAACLSGAWVVSPDVFVGEPGPSIKYVSALLTRRTIWASPCFKEEFKWEWLLILEIMKARTKQTWKVLCTSQDWAAAKMSADDKGRPADVLALVGASESNARIKHAFTIDQLVSFIANVDPGKGSIGLLSM